MDEFEIIRDLFAPLSVSFPGAMGLTDDAAVISADPQHDMVVTMDSIVAGVHFFADDPPQDIARKLVRVNLSDLAAKAARPYALMLSTAFPIGTDIEWIRLFADGLRQDIQDFQVPLIGGDTVATPGPLTLSLTAFGKVPVGTYIARSGAKPHHDLWVTGTVGDGLLGLLSAQGLLSDMPPVDQDYLLTRYRIPYPRLAFGGEMRAFASAAMDVSDGLLQDLGHMCRVSGVGAVVQLDHIPMSQAARRWCRADDQARCRLLSGGDDYELLFAAAPQYRTTINACGQATQTNVSLIGGFVTGNTISLIDKQGLRVYPEETGWRHFDNGKGRG